MRRRTSVFRAASVTGVMLASVMWLAAPANASLPITPSPTLSVDRIIHTSPFDNNSSVSMKDAEGSAYVPTDNAIWLADDNGRAVYEVDASTGAWRRTIGSATFEATKILGGTQVAGSGRDRDIESMAYDATDDILYVFSGICCSGSAQPTVFRMVRDTSAPRPYPFKVESYQPLASGSDYTASGWNSADGTLYVGVHKDIRTYDYSSNTSGQTFQVQNLRGILGMSFSADGKQLYVAHHDSSGNAQLSVVTWATKTLLPGWTFTLNPFGLRDARAVELINDRFYVLDGYDGRSKGDPLRHALYVFDVGGA